MNISKKSMELRNFNVFSRLTFLVLFTSCFAEMNLILNDVGTRPHSDVLTETLVYHIGNRTVSIIMDNTVLNSLKPIWDTLKYSYQMGSTYYIYSPFLENNETAEVKPNSLRNIYKFISKEWAFICFLDRHHSKDSLEDYLGQILYIGNGRSDVFIFVGSSTILEPLLRSPRIKKFRNAVGIEVESLFMSAYYRPSCRGTRYFIKTPKLYLPHWVGLLENCLSGHHFRISPTDFPPFMYYIRPEDSKTNTLEIHGTSYYILKNGAERYNFSIGIINATDPFSWPLMGELNNGTWDGIFGDLVYGRAEIASVSNPTPRGNGLADFIGPFGKSSLVFMSAEPVSYSRSSEYWIFQPYKLSVWLILLSGFFLCWLVNSAAFKVRHLIGKEKYAESYGKAFTMIMAFTFEQEIGKPKGFTLRFLMISWVSFMVILATSYKFNLVAFILTPKSDYVPKSFRALYDEKNYKIIFDLGGVSGWQDFNNIEDPKIHSLLSRTNSTTDTSRCTYEAFMSIQTVCAGWDFSLTFAASKNLTITLGPRQPLYKSEPLFETWFAFAVDNRSVYTNEFQAMGQSFYELGILTFWEARIIRREQYRGRTWLRERKYSELYKQLRAFREKSKSGGLEKLNLKNVQFIFIIFTAGISISCSVFILESVKDGSLLKKFARKKTIKIRKISNIVKKKLNGSLVGNGELGDDGQTRQNVITVTFLP